MEKKIKKKKYTTAELFRVINDELKANGVLPDILDYSLGVSPGRPIETDEWDVFGKVVFGGNEGIYLDLYAEGDFDGDETYETAKLGTYKTLETDEEAYMAMCAIMTKFVFATRRFVREHNENFTWSGYTVRLLKADGKTYGPRVWFALYHGAAEYVKRELQRPERQDGQVVLVQAVITDNKTGDEEIIRMEA